MFGVRSCNKSSVSDPNETKVGGLGRVCRKCRNAFGVVNVQIAKIAAKPKNKISLVVISWLNMRKVYHFV